MKINWMILLVFTSLSLLLIACSEVTKPIPTFTLSLQPPTLNLRVTETSEVKVVVNRSGGLDKPIKVTLEGEVTGLEVDPLTITGNEGILKFRATDAARMGTSFPIVKAVSGSIPRSETLTLRIGKAVANITEVIIKDNAGSTQVRQGFGDITLEISGSNLERVTVLSVGGLDTSILKQTAAKLELKVAVPHASPLGAKDLVLTTEGGDVTKVGAVVVTPITSGPSGNDTTGVGTSDKPYRTLKHALAITQSGDTVKLLNGVYNTASGEAWPQVSGAGFAPGPNIPVGIRVEGESVTETILEGPGAKAAPALVGLAFAGNAVAANLTVKNFAAGLFITTGDITLSKVWAEANELGLAAGGGQVTIEGSEFTANGMGILAVNTASLELSGSSSHHNTADGLRLGDGTPTLSAKDFEAHHNTNGIAVTAKSSLVLVTSKLYDNSAYGLEASGQASVALEDCELYNNTMGGLLFGGATLRVRGTTIYDNPSFGAYIGGEPIKVDFGTFIEPGNNTLENNAKTDSGPGGDQLLDVRTDRATLGEVVFTMSATTFNGVEPTPDVYPGDGKWPYLNSPYFTILGINNVIQVF